MLYYLCFHQINLYLGGLPVKYGVFPSESVPEIQTQVGNKLFRMFTQPMSAKLVWSGCAAATCRGTRGRLGIRLKWLQRVLRSVQRDWWWDTHSSLLASRGLWGTESKALRKSKQTAAIYFGKVIRQQHQLRQKQHADFLSLKPQW